MPFMPPIVYINEVVDFEGEGWSSVESAESVASSGGGAWILGIGIVGTGGGGSMLIRLFAEVPNCCRCVCRRQTKSPEGMSACIAE